jgi:NarL family two-component system sensor histidine kinase LiaS
MPVRWLNHFRRLQWKLTMSYTVTTVLADLFLLLLGVVGVTYFIYSQFIGTMLAAELAAKLHDDGVTYLMESPPDREELHTWLQSLIQDGRLREDMLSSGEEGIYLFSAAQVQHLTVVDPEGIVLASVGAEAVPPERELASMLEPQAAQVLQTALNDPDALVTVGAFGIEIGAPDGAEDTTTIASNQSQPQLGTRTSAGQVVAAIPLVDEQGQVRGSLFAAVEQPFGTLALVVLVGTLSLFAVVVLMSIVPTAIVGAVFGFVTARGLSRRLGRLVAATTAWRQGDFTVQTTDRSRDEIGQLTHHLNGMATDLQTLLQVRQELAALEERNRLARDLHDAAKQQLFATVMQVNAARALLRQDVDAADAKLAHAEQIGREAQKELSLLIHELRPVALEQQPLPDALEAYAEEWSRQSGIGLRYTFHGTRQISPAIEQALFRVSQEALANVLRHSDATHVEIALEHDQATVTLTIADNGRGFDPDKPRQGGIGLRSMGERLATLDGTLLIDSAPTQGTRITAQVPDTTDEIPRTRKGGNHD